MQNRYNLGNRKYSQNWKKKKIIIINSYNIIKKKKMNQLQIL
jgi:hypothetical protein